MAHLMLVNIEDGTTDDEIREFLEKYGFPPFDEIERLPGDGSRPAAMLSFDDVDVIALGKLRDRIHDIYWKHRQLGARVMSERFA